MKMFFKLLSTFMFLMLIACREPFSQADSISSDTNDLPFSQGTPIPSDISELDRTVWQYDGDRICLVFSFKKHPDFDKDAPVYFVGYGSGEKLEDAMAQAQAELDAEKRTSIFDGAEQISFETGKTGNLTITRTFRLLSQTTAESIVKLSSGVDGSTFIMELHNDDDSVK